MYIFSILMALFAGVLVSFQGIVNSVGGKAIGIAGMIAWLSIVQAIPPLILILYKSPSIGLGPTLIQGFKWYALSGILGIIIIAFVSLSIPQIGSLQVFVLIILGQIITATIADQIGLFGIQVKPINTLKIVSIIIIIFGVFLLYKSDVKTENVVLNKNVNNITDNSIYNNK